MKSFASISQLLCAITIGLASSISVFANTEFRQIADYFSISLNPVVEYEQSPSLGQAYSQYFQKTTDFKFDVANRFGKEHPQLIVPLRDYLQQLVDEDFISQSNALTTLRAAVLGAVETRKAEWQEHIKAQDQREVMDETEEAVDTYVDQVEATMDKKLDNVSERVDALARLNNLSEANLNGKRSAADSRLEEYKLEFGQQIDEFKEIVNLRVNILSEQLGTLTESQFNSEIELIISQIDKARNEAIKRSESINSSVDNTLYEIFAKISRTDSESEQRETQFIESELRLLRENSDLRERLKEIEQALKISYQRLKDQAGR